MLFYKRYMYILISILCIQNSTRPITSADTADFLNFMFVINWGDPAYSIGPHIGSASALAIKAVENKQLLPKFNLSGWTIVHSKCDVRSVRTIVETWKGLPFGKLHGVFGPSCSPCLPFSAFFSAFNIPQISFGCLIDEVSNRTDYPTFRRFYKQTDLQLMGLFISLASTLVWKDIIFVTDFRLQYGIKFASRVKLAVEASLVINITVIDSSKASDDGNDSVSVATKATLKHVIQSEKPQVVVLVQTPDFVSTFMQAADKIGLKNKNVLFISVQAQKFFATTDQARQRYENFLLIIGYPSITTPDYERFREEVFKEFTNDRFHHFTRISSVKQVDSVSAHLYDSVIWMAMSINYTLRQKAKITDLDFGRKVMRNLKNVSFQGISGPVSHQQNLNFTIYVMMNGIPTALMTYSPITVKRGYLAVDWNAIRNITWPTTGHTMPACYYYILLADGAVAGIVICMIIVFAFGFGYPVFKRKLKKQLLDDFFSWKLKFEHLSVVSSFTEGDGETNFKSKVSGPDLPSGKTHVTPTSSRQGFRGQFGFYEDKRIVMKIYEIQPELFSEFDREFEKIKSLQDDNLNQFVGACIKDKQIYVCTIYCEKGSLYDVIHNSRMSFSWDFRLSLVSDIAKGMTFLHYVALLSHGHLTSKNCLVSPRWTCKVSDFGMPKFKEEIRRKSIASGKDDLHGLVWTAPELLRMNVEERPILGTFEGDVYSFGIIVHELCYMGKPFGDLLNIYGISEIIRHLKVAPSTPSSAFRPLTTDKPAEMLGDTHSFNSNWTVLMEQSWQEEPETRPIFQDMGNIIRRISGGRTISAIDNMIKILEIRTQSLEDNFVQQNREIVLQKKRAEELVYNILPREVFAQLKEGKQVLPESYEAVTLLLTDIVSFTPLAAAMNPIQVINFLGQLYSLFDQLIDEYDVYKVETIGDAYLVVSGLPTRNGDEHASAICTFALNIVSNVLTFSIPDFPEKSLKVRVGIHTGPVLAGVVGQKMPRFCLFGDTVLIVNEVSSSAGDNVIVISQTTHLLLESNEPGVYSFRKYGYVNWEGDLLTYQLISKYGFYLQLPSVT